MDNARWQIASDIREIERDWIAAKRIGTGWNEFVADELYDSLIAETVGRVVALQADLPRMKPATFRRRFTAIVDPLPAGSDVRLGFQSRLADLTRSFVLQSSSKTDAFRLYIDWLKEDVRTNGESVSLAHSVRDIELLAARVRLPLDELLSLPDPVTRGSYHEDLHGLRTSEALAHALRVINAAWRRGAREVQLVHGAAKVNPASPPADGYGAIKVSLYGRLRRGMYSKFVPEGVAEVQKDRACLVLPLLVNDQPTPWQPLMPVCDREW